MKNNGGKVPTGSIDNLGSPPGSSYYAEATANRYRESVGRVAEELRLLADQIETRCPVRGSHLASAVLVLEAMRDVGSIDLGLLVENASAADAALAGLTSPRLGGILSRCSGERSGLDPRRAP